MTCFYQGQHLELTAAETEFVDVITQTSSFEAMFDELIIHGYGDTINDTVSNLPLFHHHPIIYSDRANLDREKEKRAFLLNMAAQVM